MYWRARAAISYNECAKNDRVKNKPGGAMQKKILVVDDEPHIVKAIRYYLEDENYEVITAEEGGGAIELAENQQPDLIILDVMMPCMDGFEVCRELRSRNRTRLIPIIFLTAREGVEDKVTGFELGADDYITKPFNNRELLARIKSRIRRSEDELSSSPVTGLPGGNVVEQESNRWLQAGRPFYAIFIQLDGFEHYRRAYGLNQGRHLLQYLARLISTVLEDEEEEGGGGRDFLGHSMEDEFVIFTTRPDPAQRCRRIASLFELGKMSFLPEPARAREEIVYYDFMGKAIHAPLPRLLVACLNTSNRFSASHTALSTWAAQALMQARSLEGGAFVLEE
jgi:DNA-binding response OmpR family regulator